MLRSAVQVGCAIAVLAIASLYALPARAANGQCVWEGGLGAPTYPSCKAEDCIGSGGVALCENPEIVPSTPWIEGQTDSGRYRYHGCDVAPPSMAEHAGWCVASGGTWNGSSQTCVGGTGASTPAEDQMDGMATAYLNARYPGCSVTYMGGAGWGGGSSSFCWNVGTAQLNNVEKQATKTRQYHLSCPNTPPTPPAEFDKTIAILRNRTLKCPSGTTTRTLPNGFLQCVHHAEAETNCSDFVACTTINNPVSIVSGAKVHRALDYKGGSASIPAFERFYRSSGYFKPWSSSAVLKDPPATWQHSYQRRLVLNPAPGWMASLHFPDGRLLQFDSNGKEVLNGSGGGAATLQQLAGTGWLLTLSSRDLEYYDTSGRITSLVTRAGLSTTLSYDGAGQLTNVAGPFGHQLSFAYDNYGRLASVTVPGNLVYSYGYDASASTSSQAALSTVTYPDATVLRYHYEGSKLTGITDENNARFATYTYDDQGRVQSTERAGGANRLTYQYGTTFPYSLGSTSVTDSLGRVGGYDYFYVAGVYRPGRFPDNCHTCANTRQIDYDNNGNPQRRALRTGSNGGGASYSYDPLRNLETSRSEGLSLSGSSTGRTRTTTTQWHSTFRLPTLITEPRHTTSFSYDANGNVLTKTVTDTSVTPNVARTWTYTYSSTGQMLTADGPRTDVSDVTTYTYYSCTAGAECGQLETTANALGQVTTFNAYNADGQPLTITDPNGTVTTLTYDARQRLTSRTVGGESTTWEYWPTGLLRKATLPDSSHVLYTYDDAHRLIRIDDDQGNHISYTVDSMGNRTAENVYDPTNFLARMHTRVFDTFNRLQKEIGAAGTASVTTSYAYNFFNQGEEIASVSAPLGRTTSFLYDELNRLSQVTDPANGATQFSYNADDNLTSVADPRGKVTSYQYTGFGDLKQLISPDTGNTTSTYDSSGNLATRTDARSKTGTYAYDKLNRLTSITYPDQTLTFTYDAGTNGAGRLTGASDANHSLSWSYDAQGRVSAKSQTVGAVTKTVSYGYTNGNLTSLVTPSGQTITYGYTAGRIASLMLNGSTTILGQALYDPFGPVRQWTWGNSSLANRTFDPDGKLTNLDSAGAYSYAYDDAFRITGVTDLSDSTKSWTYGYDVLDRLNAASKSGQAIGYTYDANGNRLSQTGTSTATYTISPTSNRVTSITGMPARTYSYDAAGNVTGYGGVTFSYSDSGRLISTASGGITTSYILNALGQRVKRSNSSVTAYFVYDEAGHLIGEYDNAGALVQETVWFGDIPVATLKPNGSSGVNVFYIHTDHLDTPRKITRPSDNAIVWRWDSDPFGATPASEDPDGDWNLFVYNLRFPGQYYDAETGLHYNYFRDYDPATGRYVESDPIGLRGGINTYAYVGGNPVDQYDPFGLAVCNGKWVKYGEHVPTLPTGRQSIPLWTCSCYWM